MVRGTDTGVPLFNDIETLPVGTPDPVDGLTVIERLTGVVPVYGEGLVEGEINVIVVVVRLRTRPLP